MMDELQAIYDDPRHASDIDLMCSSSWDTVHSFDWERKVKNTTVDVLRGVEVGLTKNEDGVRMLLVRFVDTALDYVQPSGGAWYNWKEHQPSVWAMAFTAPEMRAIAQALQSEASSCRLIHREPWTEPSTWSAKAEWIVEEDDSTRDITGVRIFVQASQEVVPQIHEVRFQSKGHYFRFTSSTDISSDAWIQLSSSYQKVIAANPLPPDLVADLPPWDPPTHKIPIKTDYVTQGDSRFECEMDLDSVAATARMYTNDNGRVVQVVTSGKIILRNPTADKMYIQRVYTVYSATGETMDTTMHDKATTRIGACHGTCMDWGIPHPDVSWSNTTSLELPPKSIHEVCIETSIVLPETATLAFGSKPFSMRLHPHFGEPLTVHATFLDNEQRTQTIAWDYSNTPLEPRNINTYADIIAHESCSNDNGMGDSFDCLVFLTWDNPRTLLRTYLVVTQSKQEETDGCWYICATDTTGECPMRSNITFTAATDLARLGYDAPSDEVIIDRTAQWCSSSSSHCQIRLLVDQHVVYGLVARVVDDNDEVILSRSVYLDPSSSSSGRGET